MISAIALYQKAAACRRLALQALQPNIAQALLELANDFEQAALDCELDEHFRGRLKKRRP